MGMLQVIKLSTQGHKGILGCPEVHLPRSRGWTRADGAISSLCLCIRAGVSLCSPGGLGYPGREDGLVS